MLISVVLSVELPSELFRRHTGTNRSESRTKKKKKKKLLWATRTRDVSFDHSYFEIVKTRRKETKTTDFYALSFYAAYATARNTHTRRWRTRVFCDTSMSTVLISSWRLFHLQTSRYIAVLAFSTWAHSWIADWIVDRVYDGKEKECSRAILWCLEWTSSLCVPFLVASSSSASSANDRFVISRRGLSTIHGWIYV